MAIVNSRIQKKSENLDVLKVTNDNLELQNNIIEQLLPVFDKKDLALDSIAAILEQMMRRQELNDITIRNFSNQLEQRCEAPILIKEIKKIQNNYDKRSDREGIINSLIIGEEVSAGKLTGNNDVNEND